MYAKHQLNIEIYLREKTINFSKEDDVIKLMVSWERYSISEYLNHPTYYRRIIIHG